MAEEKAKLWSSVGKKALMAVTGLLLVTFVIEHLLGNLLLFTTDPDPFNKYAYTLMSLGKLLIAVELVFLAFFILHMYSGLTVYLSKRKARPDSYRKSGNAGNPSKKTLSSTTMIISGLVLLVFVAIHLKTFKFGPNYTTFVDGVEMRDLYKLVYQTFAQPLYVFWYVLSMVILGLHLRHGVWSAFQSLGLHHHRFTPAIYTFALIFAVVWALGFIAMPIWIFFDPLNVRQDVLNLM